MKSTNELRRELIKANNELINMLSWMRENGPTVRRQKLLVERIKKELAEASAKEPTRITYTRMTSTIPAMRGWRVIVMAGMECVFCAEAERKSTLVTLLREKGYTSRIARSN